eukprot:TRINITY_DN743_c0_g1_i10.p2 TRINITY_DN743_c0_g1~~TRINITY_DN743_c0_g1_i10.p2  ORF type:complete len:350 (+),score=103.82 TRINITY_DN743_c0_g1_i10:1193-2242(+)
MIHTCKIAKDSERVQISENTSLITEAIEKAHKIYNKEKSKVLFVVDDFEGNLFDQRSLESSLLERGVECLRRSFSKIKDTLVVDPTTGILTVEGKEISVVYYRCGYDPHHFRTEEDWTTREKLELSYAIKCPSVDLQLVNFKIFQLILQDDQHLHRFLSESEGNELKRNFARIWGINETNLPELKRLVEANPSAYVLKPQREGGGNNFYDDAIQKQFNTLDMEELKTFILMEKINPMSRVSMMIRNRELNVMDTISELGFYSYMISEPGKLHENVVNGGYLLRTKKDKDNEGGVAAGYSYLDALLIEDELDNDACCQVFVVCVSLYQTCLLYTSPSPRDGLLSRMPSSA